MTWHCFLSVLKFLCMAVCAYNVAGRKCIGHNYSTHSEFSANSWWFNGHHCYNRAITIGQFDWPTHARYVKLMRNTTWHPTPGSDGTASNHSCVASQEEWATQNQVNSYGLCSKDIAICEHDMDVKNHRMELVSISDIEVRSHFLRIKASYTHPYVPTSYYSCTWYWDYQV